MTSKITKFQNLDYNSINLVITDKYINVFNANQTPYPIFDQYKEIGYWNFLFRAKGLGVMWVLMGYFEVVLMYYYN